MKKKKRKPFDRLLSPPAGASPERVDVVPGARETLGPNWHRRVDRVEVDGRRIDGRIETEWKFGQVSASTVFEEETVPGIEIDWLLVKNGLQPRSGPAPDA